MLSGLGAADYETGLMPTLTGPALGMLGAFALRLNSNCRYAAIGPVYLLSVFSFQFPVFSEIRKSYWKLKTGN